MARWVRVTNFSNGNFHWVNTDVLDTFYKYPDTNVPAGQEGKISISEVGLIVEDENYLLGDVGFKE